jgi:hypothetical protein
MTVHNHFYLAENSENQKIVITTMENDSITVSIEKKKPEKFMANWYNQLVRFIEEEAVANK